MLIPLKIVQFFGILSKVVGTNLPPPTPLTYPKRWNGSFEWLFCKNIKEAFNDRLPYINHFVILHSFLRISQILLTFTRYLTVIKSNFKQFHIFNAYSKLQRVFTLCVRFSLYQFLAFILCSYFCKLFVIKDFLLTSSSDV